MEETEFRAKLKKCEIGETALCTFVYNETGAIIHRRHIRSYFQSNGRLSEPMTGLFRFAFKKLEADIDERAREIQREPVS